MDEQRWDETRHWHRYGHYRMRHSLGAAPRISLTRATGQPLPFRNVSEVRDVHPSFTQRVRMGALCLPLAYFRSQSPIVEKA